MTTFLPYWANHSKECGVASPAVEAKLRDSTPYSSHLVKDLSSIHLRSTNRRVGANHMSQERLITDGVFDRAPAFTTQILAEILSAATSLSRQASIQPCHHPAIEYELPPNKPESRLCKACRTDSGCTSFMEHKTFLFLVVGKQSHGGCPLFVFDQPVQIPERHQRTGDTGFINQSISLNSDPKMS